MPVSLLLVVPSGKHSIYSQSKAAPQINQVNIFIGAAAVADYRPSEVSTHKIKKNAETLTLNFIKNSDILSQVSARKHRPFVVGFAAETENVLQNAGQKRLNKKLDMIIANPVNSTETGFDSNDNCGWILTAESSIELPHMSKAQMAIKILEAVANVLMTPLQYFQKSYHNKIEG